MATEPAYYVAIIAVGDWTPTAWTDEPATGRILGTKLPCSLPAAVRYAKQFNGCELKTPCRVWAIIRRRLDSCGRLPAQHLRNKSAKKARVA
jgi:hypothetical protein